MAVADALMVALPVDTGASTSSRDAFIAALNGVFGDHLEATGNRLANDMSLHVGGRAGEAALVAPTAKIVVLVHGLAMNDLQWSRRGHHRRDGHGPAQRHRR
jgi:hypothetical protein